MRLITEKNTIEVRDGEVFVDGTSYGKGKTFYCDPEAFNEDTMDGFENEPKIGLALVLSRKEEIKYFSLAITEIS